MVGENAFDAFKLNYVTLCLILVFQGVIAALHMPMEVVVPCPPTACFYFTKLAFRLLIL